MTDNPKIYLAGPDVFRPNAKEIGDQLREECARRGLIGLWPADTDNFVGGHTSARGYATEIFKRNLAMIRQAHAVIANLTPFRGPHCDVGTAFEIGYAMRCSTPVFGYLEKRYPPTELIARIWCEETPHSPEWRDAHGNLVENFGLIDNLMVAAGIGGISTSASSALDIAVRYLRTGDA